MIALDLFAGTGWGVACRALGIEEHGVELMPEAVATRALNGMSTLYEDVWEGLEIGGPRLPEYDLLIASPPCQTFSLAGGGSGRAALDEVLQAIDDRAYVVPFQLRQFGERHDPRTALVLAPLAHVFRDAPTFVVLEQVPPVLPVWERYAEVMRGWGYSVWTGNLQAEQYGVPQTRRRAILIARADGVEAAPPVPTHSRYYPRDPGRLDEGVLPWVSMGTALGWDAPGVMRSNYGTGGDPAARGERDEAQPAPTMTSKAGRNKWDRPAFTVTGGGNGSQGGAEPFGRRAREAMPEGTSNVSVAEAAALQSYPPGFEWAGTKTKQFLQVGNAVPPLLAEAILRTIRT